MSDLRTAIVYKVVETATLADLHRLGEENWNVVHADHFTRGDGVDKWNYVLLSKCVVYAD